MSKLFKLPENYSWNQLKESYKKLAIQNHPDKGGDPDFFNFITEQFQKLAIEIKNRDSNKSHFDLKQDHKETTSLSNRFGISQVANDTFSSKFNKAFDENRFVDEDVEFGYGGMMDPSSKVREDINITNVFGKSSVSSEKFNTTFEKIIYKERIFVNKRIRDLKYSDKYNAVILALEDWKEIGILSQNIKDFTDQTPANKIFKATIYLRRSVFISFGAPKVHNNFRRIDLIKKSNIYTLKIISLNFLSKLNSLVRSKFLTTC